MTDWEMDSWEHWQCGFCGYSPRYEWDDETKRMIVLAWAPEPERARAPRPSVRMVLICPSCRGKVTDGGHS